jgi:hypothetical protein
MHVRAIYPIAFCAVLSLGVLGCDTYEGDPDSAISALYQCPEPVAALAKSGQDTILPRDPIAPDSVEVRVIPLFQGSPSVAGIDVDNPGYQVAVQDGRTLTGKGAIAPGSGTRIGWIVPMGFDSAAAAGLRPNRDGKCFSAIQVVSERSYTSANVILDSQCRPIREFPFAYAKPDTLNSATTFIVWDLKDEAGKVAATGDYYWNAEVTAGSDKRVLRTKIRITTDASCE